LDPILENLVNYGVLGMWTASLLWNNHITKKNFQSRYDNLNDDLKEGVKEIKRLLEYITIRMTSIENAYDSMEDEQKSTNSRILTDVKENRNAAQRQSYTTQDMVRAVQDMIQNKNQEDMLKSQIRRVITKDEVQRAVEKEKKK
jgi:hypothetical protein